MGHIRTKSKPEIIALNIGEYWSTIELRNFLSYIAKVYNIFLALNLKKFIQSDLSSNRRFGIRSILEDKLTPLILKKKRSNIKNYLHRLMSGMIVPPLFKEAVHVCFLIAKYNKVEDFARIESDQILKVLENNPEIMGSFEVYRIRIGSPGLISFQGLADVIREMREWFKDICYRMRQEETMGNLNITEKRLEIIEKYHKLSDKEKKMVDKKIFTQIKNIQKLERKGRVINIEESDAVEE